MKLGARFLDVPKFVTKIAPLVLARIRGVASFPATARFALNFSFHLFTLMREFSFSLFTAILLAGIAIVSFASAIFAFIGRFSFVTFETLAFYMFR